jgi:endonuclease/exonuclease/phosphatase (EEP) superfamily protein YafD
MISLRIAVVMALALAACGPGRRPAPPGPAPARAANQLRVMSFNVNFGMAGDPATIAAIASADADVVFLQETNPAWEAALVGELGARYPHHRFTAPPNWRDGDLRLLPGGGMGLLSKTPIVSIDQLPSFGGVFFAWRVVLDTQLGRIQVLNVHLHPPMSKSGSWVVGYFSTRADRLREIEYHVAALDPALPTLILGDFNEERTGLAIQRLVALGYADAIAEHQGDRRTWEWPIGGGVTLRFQLDHIMHDDHFIAVTARIVEGGRSDHKPIWVDFERLDP